ncbi:MAG TPA: hypothetical protein VGL81_22845 [Polyangiaceae bacterium]|jgi:hypothetical protein
MNTKETERNRKMGEAVDRAKEVAERAGHAVQEGARKAGHAAQEAAEKVGHRAQEVAHKAGHRVNPGGEKPPKP